jgi:hypothetical protein
MTIVRSTYRGAPPRGIMAIFDEIAGMSWGAFDLDYVETQPRKGVPLHHTNPDRIYLSRARPIKHGPRGVWRW